MKENDYRFGNFVCQLREEKGMTQAELAEKLDVTAAAVSKWENGESKPRTEKLFELANILGVTAEELMQGQRIPQKQTVTPYGMSALPHGDTRFKRIGAFIIDALLCEFTAMLLVIPVYETLAGNRNGAESTIFKLTTYISFVTLIFVLLRDVMCGGRSIGKRVTRLTIADSVTGTAPKFYKLVLRNLPFFIYFIDFFVLIINGQSLGDMMTNTFTPIYLNPRGIRRPTRYDTGAMAQSFVTPPKQKRKVFIIVACVIVVLVLFFTAIFAVAFGGAKQSEYYPAVIQSLMADKRLSDYDNLTESDFFLNSYRFSGSRSGGTWYEQFGFWVKGQNLYATVRSIGGEVKIYNTPMNLIPL